MTKKQTEVHRQQQQQQDDDGATAAKNNKSSSITMSQINSDRLTHVSGAFARARLLTTLFFIIISLLNNCIILIIQLANQYWSPHSVGSHQSYNAAIIEDIYYKEINQADFSIRRIMLLEFSQYLENYLWPHYKRASATHAHMMSIVVMLNEKFRERVDAWALFSRASDEFADFFQQVLEACLAARPLTAVYLREQTALILFLNHCFNSMEVALCRDQAKRLVSLAMWTCLQPSTFSVFDDLVYNYSIK